MSERKRLIHPIVRKDCAGILNLLIKKFVPEFQVRERVSDPALIEYQSAGVTIRRKKCEHSYENSDETWWPASHWWECEVTGIPGITKLLLSTGTSAPGADEE